jgi:threonine/homoserine/homoserine lactone efflux protein
METYLSDAERAPREQPPTLAKTKSPAIQNFGAFAVICGLIIVWACVMLLFGVINLIASDPGAANRFIALGIGGLFIGFGGDVLRQIERNTRR